MLSSPNPISPLHAHVAIVLQQALLLSTRCLIPGNIRRSMMKWAGYPVNLSQDDGEKANSSRIPIGDSCAVLQLKEGETGS
jgi:hypothetical protein